MNDFITIPAAIKEFKLGRSTLYRAIDAGELIRYERGGDKAIYLSRKAIIEWRKFSPKESK